MVKNLPTVERSTRIRFGKNCTENQADNTIVFNASNVQINAEYAGSVYMTPLRSRTDLSDRNITVLAYNQITKEVMDSGAVAEDILDFDLEAAVRNGNVTANTASFNNTVTGFTTLSNIGIANGAPIHTLDVGSNLFVDVVGSNVLSVLGGNVYIQRDLVVDGNAHINGVVTVVNTENMSITDAILELGRNNTSGDTTLDLGLLMNRPGSNVTIGFIEGTDELVLAYTQSGADGKTIVPLTSEDLDVHVYGRVLTEANVGIINTSPIHTLDVGSNLYVDEFGSNILVVRGNTNITGDLTVDTNSLYVDSVTNKVGVKTLNPDAELHVVGNAYVSSNLTVDVDTFHVDVDADRVGINTKVPDAELHIVGNVYATSNLTVDVDTLHVDATGNKVGVKTKTPDAELHIVGNAYVTSNLTVDVDTFHVDVEADRVGINTKVPDAELHIVGNAYVTSNLTVDVDTLHVDANGNKVGVKTKTPDAELHIVGNAYVSSNLTVDVDTLHVDATGNKIGVKTKTPDAELHVVGNVYATSNLTVDVDTLHVDTTTHSVGIETKEPEANLHVVGNVYVTSDLTVDVDTLHVDATTHSVGIETSEPEANLHIVGNVYVTSNLTVDVDTLHVDTTADRVGINTINPDAELHVVGNVYATSNLTVDVDTFHVDVEADRVGINTKVPDAELHIVGNAYVTSNLTVDVDTFHIDVETDRVGINTKVPDAELHIVGNAYVTSNLTVDVDTFHVDVGTDRVGINTKVPDADLHIVGNVYATSNLTVDVDTLHVDVGTDRVGINTKVPDAELHIVGNAYVTSNLTVDVNTLHVDTVANHVGINTKVPDAELHIVGNAYVTSNLTVDVDTLHVDATTHRVGIETKTPSANLHVSGNAYVTSNVDINGVLNLNNVTTALKTNLTSNVGVNIGQLNNVTLTTPANEDMLVYDGTQWVNQRQNHLFLYAKANVALTKGEVVYATKTLGNDTFVIDKADARYPSKMPAIGVVYQDLALNGQGLVVSFGRADGVALDSFIESETVYVSNTVPGGLSNVAPTGIYNGVPNLIQNVGLVVKPHASQGIVSVTGVGRTNAIPNANVITQTPAYVYTDGTAGKNTLNKIDPVNLLTKLQTLAQVVNTGNTVANTINVTGLTTTGNVNITSNISVTGLADPINKYLPMVNTDGYFTKSPVYVTDTGKYVISASEAEFLGNITLGGNTTIISSTSVTIGDRIFGIGANNSTTNLDSGFMIEHQDDGTYANVALIYHAVDHKFSIGYTQNTFTDDHILDFEDANHRMLVEILGNLAVQNNITITENLTVGTNKLFVDASSAKIGMGTVTPESNLHVVGNVYTTSDLKIGATTATTSKTSGALQVVGGVGISGDIHATHANLEDVEADSVTVTDVTAALSKTSGALQVVGGVGVQGNVHATNANFEDVEVDSVIVTDATSASSKITGALQVVGGVGIQGDIHATHANLEDVEADSVIVTDATAATSTTSGALQVVGGVGIQGDIYARQAQLSGNVTVNTNTFHVDTVTSNVGIGTTEPDKSLHVEGDIKFTGKLFEGNEEFVTSPWVTLGSNIYYDVGHISVGTSSSDANLHVVGNTYISSNLTVNTNTLHVDAVTSNVGIGTTEPDKSLHVEGDIKFTGKLFEGNEEFVTSPWVTLGSNIYYDVGHISVGASSSDANLYVAGNTYISSNLTVDTNTLHVDAVTNRVGLGTTEPAKSLDVTGDGRFQSTVESTSKTTGALVVSGGLGVSSQINASNVFLTGALITNTGTVSKKTYAYSGTLSQTEQPYINVNFTNHTFYCKITAQLVDADNDLSTMVIEAAGGNRVGGTPTKNIAVGTKNIFGSASTTPWNSTILTTPTRVAMIPSGAIQDTDGGYYNIFIEYMSPLSSGGVSTIQEDTTTVFTFDY